MVIQLLIGLSMVFGMIEALNKCHKHSSCLTCSEFPYNFNCRSCSKGSFLDRDGAYYTCTSCQYPCSECHGYSSCTRCYLEGRYGQRCDKICSKGCLNSTCEHSSGTCICRDKYEGTLCDYCVKGKYGIDSDCMMDCPQNCKRCVSDTKCTECKDGFFGDICEFKCSRGCYFGSCNKSNGTCYQDKCKPNFHGINCKTCSAGLYGTYCLLPCPDNCVTCSSNSSCGECKHGYWGDGCQDTCSHWFCVENFYRARS